MSYLRNGAKRRANRAAWVEGYKIAKREGAANWLDWDPPRLGSLKRWIEGITAGNRARIAARGKVESWAPRK